MAGGKPMNEIEIGRHLGSEVAYTDQQAKDRAQLRLEQHIHASGGLPRRLAEPARERHYGRWLATAAALVAAAVTLQVLLPRGAGGPTSARAALRRLAALASAAPGIEVGPGQFVYTDRRELQRDTRADLATGLSWTFEVPIEREEWVASDGSGRVLARFGDPVFVSQADEAAWRQSGSPPLLQSRMSDQSFEPGGLPFYDVASLPTDPGDLAALIEARKIIRRPAGDAETLDIIGILLAETYSSPDIRAALFRVGSSLPGIELLGETIDPLGRSGIAVGITEDGIRTELIFDEATSALLAQERVEAGGGPADILGWRAYMEPKVVGSVDQHR